MRTRANQGSKGDTKVAAAVNGTGNHMSEVVIFEADDHHVAVHVRLDGETVWLTQRQMAELFDTSADNVGLHLKNVFGEGELGEKATTEDFSVVQTEGRRKVTRTVKH